MERLTTKGYTYHSLDFMEDGVSEMANKLRELEDLEEQGKLIKIPFEIGRLLYDITEFKEKHEYPEIYVIDTTSFRLSKDKKGLIYILDSCEYRYEDFGVVLFASEKEAEKALAEMEK